MTVQLFIESIILRSAIWILLFSECIIYEILVDSTYSKTLVSVINKLRIKQELL
jgi:hypothetical protein